MRSQMPPATQNMSIGVKPDMVNSVNSTNIRNNYTDQVQSNTNEPKTPVTQQPAAGATANTAASTNVASRTGELNIGADLRALQLQNGAQQTAGTGATTQSTEHAAACGCSTHRGASV